MSFSSLPYLILSSPLLSQISSFLSSRKFSNNPQRHLCLWIAYSIYNRQLFYYSLPLHVHIHIHIHIHIHMYMYIYVCIHICHFISTGGWLQDPCGYQNLWMPKSIIQNGVAIAYNMHTSSHIFQIISRLLGYLIQYKCYVVLFG
jgi:hypothetical protein